MDGTAPLILTLGLDEASFARLEGLRRAHFPPHLNRIPAHVTLFHALPGDEEPAILLRLAEVVRDTAPLPLRVAAVMPLGRGTALRLEAPGAAALRARLAEGWRDWLTPQDRGGWRPHVTVQNKVAPEEARRLQEELRARFAPWEGRAEGLLLWRYRGGPWEAAGRFGFAG
jgi:hypothetical protein